MTSIPSRGVSYRVLKVPPFASREGEEIGMKGSLGLVIVLVLILVLIFGVIIGLSVSLSAGDGIIMSINWGNITLPW